MEFTDYRLYHSAVVAIDGGTGDLASFIPGCPVDIVRIGFIGTTAYTHGSGGILKVDKNASDGDGTFTRGDGDIGTLTLPATFAAGLGVYVDLTSAIQLDPGDQAVFELTQAATAGDGVCFLEYQKRPFQSGYGSTTYDRLVNMTDVG